MLITNKIVNKRRTKAKQFQKGLKIVLYNGTNLYLHETVKTILQKIWWPRKSFKFKQMKLNVCVFVEIE